MFSYHTSARVPVNCYSGFVVLSGSSVKAKDTRAIQPIATHMTPRCMRLFVCAICPEQVRFIISYNAINPSLSPSASVQDKSYNETVMMLGCSCMNLHD